MSYNTNLQMTKKLNFSQVVTLKFTTKNFYSQVNLEQFFQGLAQGIVKEFNIIRLERV